MASRHKHRIKKSGKSYSERQQDELFDELSGDNFGDGQTPWSSSPLSDAQYDKIDSLYDLYDELEGRDKQVLKLLLQGETNEYIIAKVLSMKQPNVHRSIANIRKKVGKHDIK